jgi:hypothetical protein
MREGGGLAPGLYRVTGGGFRGALVRLHFTNESGNADCRFAATFGPHRGGEVVVVRPENLTPAAEGDYAQA